ncbi:MAG: hypothetical protein Kow0090_03350 [Myxococcota bacterium]
MVVSYALLFNPNGGLVMSDSDGNHSCSHLNQKMIQEESKEPLPRCLRHAACDVNSRNPL